MKPRKFNRKGHCPICEVKKGSRHNPMCLYAWHAEGDSRSLVRKTFKQKVRATVAVWRG